MQTVGTIVLFELILGTVEGELTILDTVGIAAYAGTVVGGGVEGVGILGDVVKAEHNVGGVAILVRNDERNHTTTIVSDAYLHTVLVLQCEELHGLALDGGVELGRIKT